jgi:hypothetical protein
MIESAVAPLQQFIKTCAKIQGNKNMHDNINRQEYVPLAEPKKDDILEKLTYIENLLMSYKQTNYIYTYTPIHKT